MESSTFSESLIRTCAGEKHEFEFLWGKVLNFAIDRATHPLLALAV